MGERKRERVFAIEIEGGSVSGGVKTVWQRERLYKKWEKDKYTFGWEKVRVAAKER